MTVLLPTVPDYAGPPSSTISWPSTREFVPSRMTWGAISSRTSWAAPYTGQSQSISHLADRLRVSLELPFCRRDLAGAREAYLMAAAAAGNWLRLHHFQRPQPLGTLRGSPTVYATQAAGSRAVTIQTTAGYTMQAGDVLGVGSQLIQCGYGGAVADGSGVMLMPLVLPLRRAVTAGDALTWDKPTATFQILDLQPTFGYVAPRMQEGLQIDLVEVFT